MLNTCDLTADSTFTLQWWSSFEGEWNVSGIFVLKGLFLFYLASERTCLALILLIMSVNSKGKMKYKVHRGLHSLKQKEPKSVYFSFCVLHVSSHAVFNTIMAMGTAGKAGIDFGSGFSRWQSSLNFFFSTLAAVFVSWCNKGSWS